MTFVLTARLAVLLACALCVHPLPAHAAPGVALSAAAQIGQQMFFDKGLSASGNMACATCHDPAHAYAAPNDLAVQLGGAHLSVMGTRAVPSLRYQEYTPPYSDVRDNPDGVSTPGPGGGYTQDGRAATLAEQARIPLLAAHEMANKSAAQVVRKIAASDYAEQFRQTFGAAIFDDDKAAFEQAMAALQAFQMEDRSFHPYDSKYDLYATNKIGGNLSAAELRGFAVFNDAGKGNCVACHYNGPGYNGSSRLFTDFSYAAIGVPRNREIAANARADHFDLGICERSDHRRANSAAYCGLFKTPTLRNVAGRSVFFHNGKMKSLKDVIAFYNTRDTKPERWYPTVHGKVRKFDDLPARYRNNIDTQAPLDGRARAATPPMTDQDMADLEVFLMTLNDRDQTVRLASAIASAAPTHLKP